MNETQTVTLNGSINNVNLAGQSSLPIIEPIDDSVNSGNTQTTSLKKKRFKIRKIKMHKKLKGGGNEAIESE